MLETLADRKTTSAVLVLVITILRDLFFLKERTASPYAAGSNNSGDLHNLDQLKRQEDFGSIENPGPTKAPLPEEMELQSQANFGIFVSAYVSSPPLFICPTPDLGRYHTGRVPYGTLYVVLDPHIEMGSRIRHVE